MKFSLKSDIFLIFGNSYFKSEGRVLTHAWYLKVAKKFYDIIKEKGIKN